MLNFWRQLALPSVAIALCDEKCAVIQVPLASNVSCALKLAQLCGITGQDAMDPCFLAQHLAQVSCEKLIAAVPAVPGLEYECTLRSHKKPAVEIGGMLYYIPECYSDRPAFCVDAIEQNSDDNVKVKELIHFYPCMGLSHAHPCQQVLLGRCYSYEAAVSLLSAVTQELNFCLNRALLHCFSDDTACFEKFDTALAQFSLQWGSEHTAQFPADGLSDSEISIIQELRSQNVCHDSSDALLPKVSQKCSRSFSVSERWYEDSSRGPLISVKPHSYSSGSSSLRDSARVASTGTQEPVIRFVHAARIARSPAVEIINGIWAGTLDHALSLQWLQCKKITHVLCLLSGDLLSTARGSRYSSVRYLDWQINYMQAFGDVAEVLHSLSSVLQHRNHRVLVHCRSGKDRTALCLFAWLMFNDFDENEAIQFVKKRRGVANVDIANVYGNTMYPIFRSFYEAWLFVNLNSYMLSQPILVHLTVFMVQLLCATRFPLRGI
jgi:protein-tyrosine phosphatase